MMVPGEIQLQPVVSIRLVLDEIGTISQSENIRRDEVHCCRHEDGLYFCAVGAGCCGLSSQQRDEPA